MIKSMLLTRLFRDLKLRKFQVIILVFILGLGGGMFWSLDTTYRWQAINDFYENNYLDDGILSFPGRLGINKSDLNFLLNNFVYFQNITAWDVRYRVTLSMELNSSLGFEVTKAYIYGYSMDFFSNASVDRLSLRKGQIISNIDINQQVLVVDDTFYNEHNLDFNSPVTLRVENTRQPVNITGTITSPEWLSLVDPESTTLSLAGQFGVGYTALSTVQSWLGLDSSSINEFVFRVTKGTDIDLIGSSLSNYLKENGYLSNFQNRKSSPSYKLVVEDIENDRELFTVISLLILIIALFGLWITLNRLVTSQRREIGIDLSLGVKNSKIMFYYLSYGIVIGCFGSIITLISGYIINQEMNRLIQEFYNIPNWNPQVPVFSAFQAVLITTFCVIIASWWPARQAANLLPVQALRQDPALLGTIRSMKLVTILLAPVMKISMKSKMAIRNVLRNRRRSMATVFGFAISVSLVIFMVGIFDTMDASISQMKEDQGNWDFRITLYQPLPYYYLTNLTSESSIDSYTYGLVYFAKLHGSYETKIVQLTSYEDQVIPLDIVKGSIQDNVSTVGISIGLADDINLKLHENISLDHIQFNGLLGYSIINTSLKIDAFHERISKLDVLMPYSSMQQLLNVSGCSNQLLIKANPENILEFKEALYSKYSFIQLIEHSQDPIEDANNMFNLLRDAMNFIQYGSYTMAFSVIILTSMITRAERKREIGTMVTLGASDNDVFMTSIWEIGFLAILGIIIGFILGWIFLEIFLVPLIAEMFSAFYVKTVITQNTWLTVGISSLSLALLAQLPILIMLRKMDLSQATKVRDF